jgi:outer membrane lipoprotein LolB
MIADFLPPAAYRAGLGAALAAALLSACATPPTRAPAPDPGAEWAQRQRVLSPIKNWELNGRLSMSAANEGWQASLRWQHRDHRQTINLAGPLGGGALRLTKDEHGASLRDADQQTYRAHDLRTLMRRMTGWDVPLDGLHYWVLGVPMPEVPRQEQIDDWGRPKTMHQLGWDIEFLEYTRVGLHDLPAKLFLKRRLPGVDNGDIDGPRGDAVLEVRLVISHWAL